MSLAFPKPHKRVKAKRRLRRQRKGSVAALKRKLDAIVGAEVRSRGACEDFRQHEHHGPLQWAHGFSRRYLGTRWSLENGFCLCAGSHLYYGHRPGEWEAFMQKRLGMLSYLALQAKAFAITSYTVADLRAMLDELMPAKAS